MHFFSTFHVKKTKKSESHKWFEDVLTVCSFLQAFSVHLPRSCNLKVKNTKNQLNTVHADAILLWLLLHADKYFFTHLHSEWEH